MKVAVTDYIEDNLDWEAQEMAKAGLEFATFQLKFKPEAEVVALLKDADVIVVNMVKMTPSLLAQLPNCKLLIRHGIGYDNVDVAACKANGICFAYQPDYCADDVAEHAIALIFALVRKVVESRKTLEASSASGQWDFSRLFPLYRMDGKTLGILGVGRIGSRVARKLQSFGLRILGCDPYLSAARKAELGIEFVDQDTLFRQSDYLTVHTLLTPETKHIVNATSLAKMKQTAVLVNTSRGPMVDCDALAEALKRGVIAGAAIDVFDVEPPPPSLPLFALPNCILTPHTGWASVESGWHIRKSIVDDILRHHRGEPAKFIVSK